MDLFLRISLDFDRDRAALPDDLAIEEYARWWLRVRGGPARPVASSLDGYGAVGGQRDPADSGTTIPNGGSTARGGTPSNSGGNTTGTAAM